jgi:hypothetical protein
VSLSQLRCLFTAKAYQPIVVIRADAPGTALSEPGQVETDLLRHSSPDAAGRSAASDILGDLQTVGVQSNATGVPSDADSQSILDDIGTWPPETNGLTTFAIDNGEHLAGPGIIPTQGAMSAPPVVDQGQDRETPQLDQAALFDDRQFVAMELPPSDEQGD